MAKDKENSFRILSLDGGGIRGLITAIWLKQIQDRLTAPLWKYFDLVAGTSTGALLACGISAGIDIDRIISIYIERGQKVFPRTSARLWSRARRVFSDGTSAPRYDGRGLDEEIKGVFGNAVFGSLRVRPTLVTAYDVLTRQSVVFKNTKVEHYSLPVWEICRASASAPTYFPAHIMTLSGASVPLIDGGVVANNPTVCAIAEAVRLNSPNNKENKNPCAIERFLVASFGTGESTRPISIAESQEWGALEWSIPLIDVLFDGSADAVNYVATQLIEPENFFRLQVRLDDAYDDMDNADRTNLNALVRIATQYAENEGQTVMKSLIKTLSDLGPRDSH